LLKSDKSLDPFHRLNLMIKQLIAAFALGLAFTSAANAVTDKTKLKAEVAAMEDAFCAMAKEKGQLAAFSYFAAPDVAFLDTDPRKFRGPAAVRERMGEDRPGVALTWSAYFTDVSDDGALGYNYGRYEFRGPGPAGKEIVRGGWFLTIWKRQPDGSWKYVMDNGTPDRPAAPPAAKPGGN
jgi:ketosteroid isomerase-like protein